MSIPNIPNRARIDLPKLATRQPGSLGPTDKLNTRVASLGKVFAGVKIIKQKFTQSFGLPNRSLLPESTIREALKAEKIQYRQRLFDPFITLWAFLSQVLDQDLSCHNAVSRVIAWLASENTKIPSEDTSAYSKRQEAFIRKTAATTIRYSCRKFRKASNN